MMKEEDKRVREEIESSEINTPALHGLVREYLVAHAFVDSLQAFDASYPLRALPSRYAPSNCDIVAIIRA
jgi:hypothetical protein